MAIARWSRLAMRTRYKHSFMAIRVVIQLRRPAPPMAYLIDPTEDLERYAAIVGAIAELGSGLLRLAIGYGRAVREATSAFQQIWSAPKGGAGVPRAGS